MKQIGLQEDFTIDITGNEELQEGENIITITVTSKDGQTSKEYKIIVIKQEDVTSISAPVMEVEQEMIKPLWNRTQQILITIFTSIIAIMGIAFAIIEYCYKKQLKEQITNPDKQNNLEIKEEEKEQIEQPIQKEISSKDTVSIQEDHKIAILKGESIPKEEIKISKKEQEIKQTKSKKGKHF